MRCYKFTDNGANSGNKPRFRLELYHFHPEEGPKGTFGRGPYCVGIYQIKSSNVAEAKANLAMGGAVDLESAVAAEG